MMFGSFRLFGAAIAVVFGCSTLISYAEESAEEDLPTIAELQQAYVQANGGLSNIMGVTSLVAIGELTNAGQEPVEFKLYIKRPGLMRLQIRRDGWDYIKVYNGKEAHELKQDDDGALATREITGEQLEQLRGEAKIDGPFFELRSRPDLLKVVGEAEVNGELTYEISVAEGADVLYQRIWLHQEHFYEMKLSRQVVDESGEVSEVGIFLSDFERVGGIWSARHLQFFKNEDIVQEVVLDKIRANVGLFDSYFEKPSLND